MKVGTNNYGNHMRIIICYVFSLLLLGDICCAIICCTLMMEYCLRRRRSNFRAFYSESHAHGSKDTLENLDDLFQEDFLV